jgi:hypothetical protein
LRNDNRNSEIVTSALGVWELLVIPFGVEVISGLDSKIDRNAKLTPPQADQIIDEKLEVIRAPLQSPGKVRILKLAASTFDMSYDEMIPLASDFKAVESVESGSSGQSEQLINPSVKTRYRHSRIHCMVLFLGNM